MGDLGSSSVQHGFGDRVRKGPFDSLREVHTLPLSAMGVVCRDPALKMCNWPSRARRDADESQMTQISQMPHGICVICAICDKPAKPEGLSLPGRRKGGAVP
jgi:hypothetical protein